jgi:hypothetical protein
MVPIVVGDLEVQGGLQLINSSKKYQGLKLRVPFWGLLTEPFSLGIDQNVPTTSSMRSILTMQTPQLVYHQAMYQVAPPSVESNPESSARPIYSE